jgi:hypothetical protein
MKIFFKEKGKLCKVFFIILSLVCLSSCGGVTPTDYTITATAGAGGSISPSETVTVTEGANQAFTITPETTGSGFTSSHFLLNPANINEDMGDRLIK